jgi:hypothetical protein
VCPYDGIGSWFSGLKWRCLFVAGILRIHGATGWTVWALSGDQRIPHVFKSRGGSIDVSYPHMGMDVPGCQTVPIGCDKYVIR